MAATKQQEPIYTGCTDTVIGKLHAIQIEVDGVEYQLHDWVPRKIARQIAKLHNTDFSTAITSGRINPKGYGKNARFKVAECLAIAMSKRPYNNQSNKAA